MRVKSYHVGEMPCPVPGTQHSDTRYLLTGMIKNHQYTYRANDNFTFTALLRRHSASAYWKKSLLSLRLCLLSELWGLEQYLLLTHFIFIVLVKGQLIRHWGLGVLSPILSMHSLATLNNEWNDAVLGAFSCIARKAKHLSSPSFLPAQH